MHMYVNAFHGGTHARCIRLSSGSWRGDRSCLRGTYPPGRRLSPRPVTSESFSSQPRLGNPSLRMPIFSRLGYRLPPRILGLPGNSLVWQSTRTRATPRRPRSRVLLNFCVPPVFDLLSRTRNVTTCLRVYRIVAYVGVDVALHEIRPLSFHRLRDFLHIYENLSI